MPHIMLPPVFAARRERFHQVLAELEADGPDSTTPGCSQAGSLGHVYEWARYALLTEGDDGQRMLLCCDDLTGVHAVAADQIADGWRAPAYYDLDELAGDEPPIGPDDMVQIDGEVWAVEETDGDEFIRIVTDHATRRAHVRTRDVILRKRWEEDKRLPKRYQLAGYRVVVFFNTTSS